MLLNKVRSVGREQATDRRVVPPVAADATPSPLPAERSVYAPSASSRVVGLIGTSAIFATIVAGFFLTIRYVAPVIAPPALTVFDVKPPASPPEAPPKDQEAPKPIEKKETLPDLVPVEPVPPKITISLPIAVPAPAVTPKSVDPAPREAETAAPKTAPAPTAPQVSSNGPDTWEGRVLAQLNRYRRYPRAAQARRQQGIPYIRFVMDRDGKVLSVQLERSSGFPDLDREAVALPKRAQPLPKPPADKSGDTLELVVPVQFFLR